MFYSISRHLLTSDISQKISRGLGDKTLKLMGQQFVYFCPNSLGVILNAIL